MLPSSGAFFSSATEDRRSRKTIYQRCSKILPMYTVTSWYLFIWWCSASPITAMVTLSHRYSVHRARWINSQFPAEDGGIAQWMTKTSFNWHYLEEKSWSSTLRDQRKWRWERKLWVGLCSLLLCILTSGTPGRATESTQSTKSILGWYCCSHHEMCA